MSLEPLDRRPGADAAGVDPLAGEVLGADGPDAGPTGVEALAGLVEVGAELARHTGGWAIGRGFGATRRLLRAATSPREAVSLALDAERTLRRAAEILAREADLETRLRDTGLRGAGSASTGARAVASPPIRRPGARSGQGPRTSPVAPAPRAAEPSHRGGAQGPVRPVESDAEELRRRGEQLLERSRDVRFHEDAHPAYDRILSELAPDEGRILLLLLHRGPQPAVDVRTGGPLGVLSSKLIAPGLSMIGSRAGLRYGDRVPAYLNNLFRLGMVWFSRETLADPLQYQVLEAQPDVLEAARSVRHAKFVRRSIHLTPFGEDFCRTCLPVDDRQLAVAPEHAPPPEDRRTARPPALK